MKLATTMVTRQCLAGPSSLLGGLKRRFDDLLANLVRLLADPPRYSED